MPSRCLLYYITDRSAFGASESQRRLKLLDKIAEAAHAGIDFIQLREKDLSLRELESLAREAQQIVGRSRSNHTNTALLLNSRTDVALVYHAAGVHLRSDDVSPEDVRRIWKFRGASSEEPPALPLIAVSCHSSEEVARSAAARASIAVFGPVFEKQGAPTPAAGLEKLHQACQFDIPVLALGGITATNAESCLQAGAAGIAAIRLFQENDVADVVRTLCA
jgi:thiamine-phosphate pyrophosphorylase